MELGLIVLRQAASFRNQGDLINKCACKNGWNVHELTVSEACVGPPKGRWDKFVTLIPLWPRYLYNVLRLTAFAAPSHVIYGPVDGPYQMNLNLFAIMKNMHLAAPSEWCADCIWKSAHVPVEVVPHGIDHNDFEFSEERIEGQREHWLPSSSKRIVLFANLNPLHRKGFPHLCEALKILHERLGDKFLMVLHTGLKEAKKLYPKIVKTPNLIIEDAYNQLPFRAIALKTVAADIFVSPSLNEGFGLPILEAAAAGKTIVCLDAPAMNEIVGDKEAWLFPFDHVKTERWKNGAIAQLHEYSPASLANAMEMAITHTKESKEKAEAAYQKSLNYDYMKTYSRLLKL